MTYRFLGTFAELPDDGVRLESYGQQVELTEAQANSAILQRCPLLPESDYQTAAHTEDHLRDFHHTGLHVDAPADFLATREKLWDLMRAHRESVLQSFSMASGQKE